MPDTPDAQLLKEFARNGSEEAFTELVRRHIGLVHSVASRHTANPQHAEDITQAVFIILARKAGTLNQNTVLPGWLHHAARLTAANWQRTEARRIRREQEAFMQSQFEESPSDNLWRELSPQLDQAIASLGTTERDALVLRYFQNRCLADVGQSLGMTENAAQKRIHRALEKLRVFFSNRGVDSTATAIAESISAHSIQAVPMAMAGTVTSAALAKGAAASTSTLTLAKTTLIAMKTKTIVATSVAAIVVLGTGFYFFGHSRPSDNSPNTHITLPIQLANAASQRDAKDPLFDIGVDPETRRTSNSPPAIFIKGPTRDAVTASERATDKMLQKRGNSATIACVVGKGSPLWGKRIRITGWIKSSDVQDFATAYMCIWSKDLGFCRFDQGYDRNILQGTMDWEKVELITDVPEIPCVIYAGPDLYGPGELWADDFQIELASPDAVITDDRTWHLNSDIPNTYTEAGDYLDEHNGHSTVCIASISGTVPAGASASWTETIRAPEIADDEGRSLRMSGWMKLENVSGYFQPQIQAWGKRGAGNRSGSDRLNGTLDWTNFTVTCAVVKNSTRKIDTSFVLSGSGKAWIDMDSLKIERVK